MELQRRSLAALASIALTLALVTPSAAQNCLINAPAAVSVDASFSLCGANVSGYTYEWYGPGLSSSSQSRCVSASGLGAGTYEYQLIRSRNGVEIDRCVHVVNVGASTGGTGSCQISGPASIQVGTSGTLCAPNDGIHAYTWTGPNGFTATSSCITVSTEGTYYLASRNRITGSSRQCTHRLDVVGVVDGGSTGCEISGPESIADGQSARLCAPSRPNMSYRWTGPAGYASTARCITVTATGNYVVTLRNLSTGATSRCSSYLSSTGGGGPDDGDPDGAYWDNCPRDLQAWRNAMAANPTGASGLSSADLQAVAGEVDRRSTYFNWANDVQGLRAALSPGTPITRRKQIARQYAALLSNVAAGELGLGYQGDNAIGLDPDTPITFVGASTIGELIALTDRWLRENRGNFARLNASLNQINRGRGIGPVCSAE